MWKLTCRQVGRVGPFALALLLTASCGDSPTTPITPPVSPPTTPAPTLSTVTVEGNTSLSAVGETSQLIARASYSDGSTQDVSVNTRWTAFSPGTVGVS